MEMVKQMGRQKLEKILGGLTTHGIDNKDKCCCAS